MQDKPVNDPAAVWASAAPQQLDREQEARYQAWSASHGAHSVAEADESHPTEWRWGWSKWIGIHYGPIPVGLIIGIPLLIALAR